MELTTAQKKAFYDLRGLVFRVAVEHNEREYTRLGNIETTMVELALRAGVSVEAVGDAQNGC